MTTFQNFSPCPHQQDSIPAPLCDWSAGIASTDIKKIDNLKKKKKVVNGLYILASWSFSADQSQEGAHAQLDLRL